MTSTKKIFSTIVSKWLFAGLLLNACTVLAQEPAPSIDNDASSEQNTGKDNETGSNLISVPDVQLLKQQLLKGEVDEEEIVWLDQQSQVLALWESETSGNPYGAVLILHDDGQHPDWPGTVHPLRTNLPQFGWTTLSVSMPDTANREVPARPAPTSVPESTNADSSTADNSTDESKASADQVNAAETAKLMAADSEVDKAVANQENESNLNAAKAGVEKKTKQEDPEQLAQKRIQMAMDYLNDKGQFNIVIIAFGSSAYRAASYIDALMTGGTSSKRNLKVQGKAQRPVRALVLVSARNSLEIAEGEIMDFLNDNSMPILDVYFGDHQLDPKESKERKLFAQKNNFEHYYQVRIEPPSTEVFDGETALSRRVRGFINKHARGVKVGN